MLKRLLCALSIVAIGVGVLWATDDTFRWPIPGMGAVAGDLFYAKDVNTMSNISAVASGNVLTSAGTSTKPAWAKANLTSMVTGTLPAANGGTGNATYTTGDMLYASAATTLSKLAGVATGNALISGGVGTAPSWGKVALTTHVSGTLPAANGGTGNASYATGDLLYASAATTLSKLAAVASGQVLVSAGTNTAPTWSASPTVTTLTTSGLATLGDAKFSRAVIALGGGATAEISTIGGSGPTTGLQNSWLLAFDSTGATIFIPVWK